MTIFSETFRLKRITRRAFHWNQQNLQYVDAPLISLALQDLISLIYSRLPDNVEIAEFEKSSKPDFHILATGRRSSVWLRSGDRTALCWTVENATPNNMSIILATRKSWIFLCPAPQARMLIQCTVPGQPSTENELLRVVDDAQSILSCHGYGFIAKQLCKAQYSKFDATPIFANPMPSFNTLSVGDAAFTSDPLTGDGIGRAMRSAIYATAVLGHSDERSKHIEQYVSRLALAHLHSLESLISFYETSACKAGFSSAIQEMKRDVKILKHFVNKNYNSNQLFVTKNSQQLVTMEI